MIRTIGAALFGLVLSGQAVLAQPCPTSGLTTLTNGTNADATQVMANFNYVADCVNNYAAPSVPAGTIVPYSGFTLPSGWLWANGVAVSRSTYAGLLTALTKTSPVTITIASPGVVTWNGHGLSASWPVQFSTSGGLPTGLAAGVTYYVVSPTTNTFQVASAPGGAAINTSGTQSGTQTAIFAPYGNGDGATTFNVPDLRGRTAFGLDNLGDASPANRLTGASGIRARTPGAGGGEEMHTLTIGEIPSHSHQIGVGGIPANGVNVRATSGDGTNFGYFSSQSTGGGSPHNNMPPTVLTNYIVKY